MLCEPIMMWWCYANFCELNYLKVFCELNSMNWIMWSFIEFYGLEIVVLFQFVMCEILWNRPRSCYKQMPRNGPAHNSKMRGPAKLTNDTWSNLRMTLGPTGEWNVDQIDNDTWTNRGKKFGPTIDNHVDQPKTYMWTNHRTTRGPIIGPHVDPQLLDACPNQIMTPAPTRWPRHLPTWIMQRGCSHVIVVSSSTMISRLIYDSKFCHKRAWVLWWMQFRHGWNNFYDEISRFVMSKLMWRSVFDEQEFVTSSSQKFPYDEFDKYHDIKVSS